MTSGSARRSLWGLPVSVSSPGAVPAAAVPSKRKRSISNGRLLDVSGFRPSVIPLGGIKRGVLDALKQRGTFEDVSLGLQLVLYQLNTT